jgi:hypothetical protein
VTRRRLLLFFAFYALVALVLVGCPGGREPMLSPIAKNPNDVSAADVYFPLEDGRIYAYETREGADTGMLVAKVRRTDATHGELRLSNATKRFVYERDGVRYDTGLYVLKTPVAVGTSWPGEHGGTTSIESIDAKVDVPAGRYGGCVRTVERGGRPPGSTYASTYCPTVGMVLLEVSALGSEARAALKSYDFPVKID